MSFIKVCIIGSTGHYGYVLDALEKGEDFEISGVAPGSEGENMEGIMKELERLQHPTRLFAGYQEMLDTSKPDIAVVCCFFCDHVKVSQNAMMRGIHVFGEKPSATSLEELESLKRAYETSGVHYAAMFALRYQPCFLAAYKKVQDGAIGKVRLMNAQKSYKLGIRGNNYRKRSIYGGTIPWVGSHAIDWLHWFSGERFQSVYASQSSLYNQNHGELEVSAICQFDMSNGVIGSVNIDYLRPSSAEGHSDDRIRIVGTDGIIEVCDNNAYIMNDDNSKAVKIPVIEGTIIFMDFLRQVRGEGECMVSAGDSFCITEASLRARLSADENRVIYFP